MSTHVLCLGEMLLDCLADQPDRPEAQVASWTSYPGGAPANVACALAALGGESCFVGCLGEDPEGDSLLAVLERSGVNTAGVQRAAQPTRKVYVTRTAAGERTFASFGGKPPGAFADTHLQATKLAPDLFGGAAFLTLGTLMMAFPEAARAIERALDLADERFVKICLDVNWRPVFWEQPEQAPAVVRGLIERCDVLKLSEEEAEWLGMPSIEAITAAFDHLEGILLTRGENGCLWQVGGRRGGHPGYRVPTVDTTGAGDAFVAALLHRLSRTPLREWESAAAAVVDYACATGALSTMIPGGIGSTPDEAAVQAFLRAQAR
ncbi:carbohydrate kinase family protein [Gloeobacter morelensis]|uniref:Carbohydrate kinase n=1 Tax=Gloeobacter morelensis MG652769 TaxID=2781736 RepID=A0ABY3PMX7_9CYAN|nr:carbohydrate kinase [Gloeobacter morelensis]UFP94980.1 carbohydrate kinase [Gloeobacter morelensis MG652769]